MIHIFSLGYMKEDRDFSRYFAFLSLFIFSMLGIVLADNFVMMFIFWELVGVSSYLLIGFWFEKPSAADAAKKAFMTNRVGDFGFLLGILMVWAAFGSVSFDVLEKEEATALCGLAGFLIFCGAMGKSAQAPLHVWLPDAMEGPTPVSALIHAATMVAAGVYMLCRVFFLIEGTWAMEAIAWIGGVTALLAALMAVQQDDIKRILAYSTLSQLGYMVMVVGLGGETNNDYYKITNVAGTDAAMFHPDDPRLFQGDALPWSWLGDLRLSPRTEHLENGRSAQPNAEDLLDIFDRDIGALWCASIQWVFQ